MWNIGRDRRAGDANRECLLRPRPRRIALLDRIAVRLLDAPPWGTVVGQCGYTEVSHPAMNRIEVITSVERRRRWSAAEKARLVATMDEPAAVVREIARSAGADVSLLNRWRRQLAAERGTRRRSCRSR